MTTAAYKKVWWVQIDSDPSAPTWYHHSQTQIYDIAFNHPDFAKEWEAGFWLVWVDDEKTDCRQIKIEDAKPISSVLHLLREEKIVAFSWDEEHPGMILIEEQCDEYFGYLFTPEQIEKLIDELSELLKNKGK